MMPRPTAVTWRALRRIFDSLSLGPMVFAACACGGGGESSGPPPSGGVPIPPAAVASVIVSPSAVDLVPGQTQQMTATTRDATGNVITGRSVSWVSTDQAITRVSAEGLATGVGAGSATITATSEGKVGSASVSVVVLPVVSFVSVTTGGAHTCALTPGGALYCWGRDEAGQSGGLSTNACVIDGATFPCGLVPFAIRGGLVFTQITAGGAHTCGLTGDGSAYCFGDNSTGQLGTGTTTGSSVPVAVSGGFKFARIDAGATHTCAVTPGGTAYCWGANNRGQLGDGTSAERRAPVAVSGGLTFQMVTAGGFRNGHTCGLTNGGVGLCWGNNERGQLGVGTPDVAEHPVPTPISAGLTFTTLTAGLGSHTCGLTASGAYCWGENTFGALGNGTTTETALPTRVSGGLPFVELRAGGFIGHTCGITSSGGAFCWGENERGQVGDGSTVDRLTPAGVQGGPFSMIDAGLRHTCGRASDGALYCWGSGAAGQLGSNSRSHVSVPSKVVGQP